MKERKDRIEDAVLAVGCALDEGIVEGGGVALYKASLNLNSNFTKGLKEPYHIIEKNTGKLLNENLFKNGIIDPLKVTRCALQNAISVAKTILGTEAIVLN